VGVLELTRREQRKDATQWISYQLANEVAEVVTLVLLNTSRAIGH
jgi:hypothetical protein